MDEPLNPVSDYYNTQAPSWRFYGGIVGFHANNPRARLTEGMLNENHELRDDCNLMSNQGASAKRKGNFVQAYGLYFWTKEDFLNGGGKHRVSFDDGSLLAVHISRYWDDVDGGRWVVRDGEQFYISERQFGTPEEIQRRGRKTRLSWPLRPTKTRWVKYDPKEPIQIAFGPKNAAFAEHVFESITAVGFYIEKCSLSEGVVAVKWHSFECYATVALPDAPSIRVSMERVQPGGEAPSFHMSATPIPYALWREVYNWAVSNQYCMGLDQRGYVFDRDGDVGTMDLDGRHTADEPVTDITWLDAVLWCNALSELEGFTPCYYADEAMTEVLRVGKERNDPKKYDWQPKVFLKSAADGFRLPPAAERESGPSAGSRPGIGFRVVRGGQAPPLTDDTSWWTVESKGLAQESRPLPDDAFVKITNGTYERGDEATVTVTDFHLTKTEVSFAEWRAAYDWAVRKGYEFDRDGDMGSMDWDTGGHTHEPTEPVADVGWFDCVVWCNALSEMRGRMPVYYEDGEKTHVLRRALPWRIRMVAGDGYHREHAQDMPVHTKWEADGYRLPTWAEWSTAWRTGDSRLMRGGLSREHQAREGANEWLKHSSGGRTHPVGSRTANAYGLFDLGGNVSEWLHDTPVDDYYRPHDPKGEQRDSLFGIAIAGGHFNSAAKGVGRKLYLNRKSAAWPWLGFRVARCDANAHQDRPFVPKVVLDVKPEDLDSLPGRTFRGNSQRTGFFGAKGLPRLHGVKWTFQTGGPVRSSPVVAEGTAFVGSDDGHFYAIDAASGVLKWKFNTGGPISGSATVDRRGVAYIGSANGYLFAFDAETGDTRWRYTREPKRPSRFPITTSPAVAHGVVFVGLGRWPRHYLGIDAGTGKEVWRLRRFGPNPGLLAPTIVGTTLYAPVNDNVLLAVDLRTELPIRRSPGHHCKASLAIADGVILYNNGSACRVDDLDDGHKIFDRRVKGGGLSFFPQSGPAIHDGIAYFAKGDNHAYAFDVKSRPVKQLWSTPVPERVRSSLAIAGSEIYFGCDDSYVYALDRKTGKQRWRFSTGGPVASSPCLSAGVLYVGSEDGKVYALH